ncbi:MAG: tetratricopeptide repeat protein, partial [Desulfamplus sp.]|nr:tetratricopeptide repeat protein [Desulfamplus sp.]
LEPPRPSHELYAEAYLLMGRIHAQLLNFKMAFQFWDMALETSPETRESIEAQRLDLAEYWLKRAEEEPTITVKCLKRTLIFCNKKEFLLKVKEKFWQYINNMLMRWVVVEGKFEDAREFLDLLKPLRDSTPEWDYIMGKFHMHKGEKTDALLHIEKAVLHPFDQDSKPVAYPGWMQDYARVLIENSRFDEGIERLGQAVAMDPNQAALWEEIGDTLFENKDYSTAAVAYEKCYTALPDKIDVLRKFGDCYRCLNHGEAARAAYEAVLEKDPSNEAARSALGKLL